MRLALREIDHFVRCVLHDESAGDGGTSSDRVFGQYDPIRQRCRRETETKEWWIGEAIVVRVTGVAAGAVWPQGMRANAAQPSTMTDRRFRVCATAYARRFTAVSLTLSSRLGVSPTGSQYAQVWCKDPATVNRGPLLRGGPRTAR